MKRTRFLWLLGIVLGAASSIALAQPEQPVPIRRMYGVGDDEFFRGGWMATRPGTADTTVAGMDSVVSQLWNFCDALGISVIRHDIKDDFGHFYRTRLAKSARTTKDRLIMAHGAEELYVAPKGRAGRRIYDSRSATEISSW